MNKLMCKSRLNQTIADLLNEGADRDTILLAITETSLDLIEKIRAEPSR